MAATDQKIEVGNLVGYLVHPNLEPERVVMRVTALPSDSVRGKRAKGEILACSGSDKSQIGKTGHFFLQDIDLVLIESDIDSWIQLEIPSYAYDITGRELQTKLEKNDIPVLMAPPGHGAGVAVIIPNLLSKGSGSSNRKRGYSKPTPWPSK